MYKYLKFPLIAVYDSGINKLYINSTSKENSTVRIDELIVNKSSAFIGIKGTFSGILYEENNPLDSVVIEDCRFTFKRIIWGENCQCNE